MGNRRIEAVVPWSGGIDGDNSASFRLHGINSTIARMGFHAAHSFQTPCNDVAALLQVSVNASALGRSHDLPDMADLEEKVTGYISGPRRVLASSRGKVFPIVRPRLERGLARFSGPHRNICHERQEIGSSSAIGDLRNLSLEPSETLAHEYPRLLA